MWFKRRPKPIEEMSLDSPSTPRIEENCRREAALADARRVYAERSERPWPQDRELEAQQKEKMARVLVRDPEAADALFVGVAGVESLYLPFSVSEGEADGPLDRTDKGYLPGAGVVAHDWEWPPPWNKPECGELLKVKGQPVMVICRRPKDHEGKHGKADEIYEHLRMPEPIIVGLPPQDEIRKLLRMINAVHEQVKRVERANDWSGFSQEDSFGDGEDF